MILRRPPPALLLLLAQLAPLLPRPAAAAPPPSPAAGTPDAAAIFAPFAAEYPVDVYRSGSGAPGPGYWQNRADYRIDARLDPATQSLSGHETITYTNNSPEPLDIVWVQLDQNIYRDGSRASFLSPYFDRAHTDGDIIDSVRVGTGAAAQAAPTLVSDTRLRITLPHPLAAHGGRTALQIAWHYRIPGPWGGRTAATPSPHGMIYEIAQWFPRMAVFDDLRGWDTEPYLGSEFYLEYGDIDYRITLPANLLVVGSGALLDPGAVLSPTERARLAQAARSDRTVTIRSPQEVEAATAHAPAFAHATRTWHFRMHDTRDVAFAASAAFAWDAARLRLPDLDGHKRLAMSVYPVEAAGPAHWARSTEYVKNAVEYFSRRWYPYPWPDAINVAGHGANMEYPAIVFDGIKDAGRRLFWVTTHEIGHSWFPMLVGSNERRAAFMDEGFNTFIDTYASDDFNHGEFAPKRDSEYAPGGGNPVDEILPLLRNHAAPAITEESDLIGFPLSHAVSYFKAALGLRLLREQILGPDRFDHAFRRYIALWAYKHPSPSDFFRLMDSEGGEDLSWFWRGWFTHNWTMDLAVRAIDPARAEITLGCTGGLVMPATLAVEYTDGSSRRLRIPVEIWMHGPVETIAAPGSARITRATIDPDHVLPVDDRTNNSLAAPAPLAPPASAAPVSHG